MANRQNRNQSLNIESTTKNVSTQGARRLVPLKSSKMKLRQDWDSGRLNNTAQSNYDDPYGKYEPKSSVFGPTDGGQSSVLTNRSRERYGGRVKPVSTVIQSPESKLQNRRLNQTMRDGTKKSGGLRAFFSTIMGSDKGDLNEEDLEIGPEIEETPRAWPEFNLPHQIDPNFDFQIETQIRDIFNHEISIVKTAINTLLEDSFFHIQDMLKPKLQQIKEISLQIETNNIFINDKLKNMHEKSHSQDLFEQQLQLKENYLSDLQKLKELQNQNENLGKLDVSNPQAYLTKMPQELVQYLMSEPKDAKQIPLARWRDLGPLDLCEIIANNNKEIQYENEKLGKPFKTFDFDIYGQLDKNHRKMNGIGRANYQDMIYEGQFKNGVWDGYGRCIYQDGRYHIGNFKNDRKNGLGRTYKPNGEKKLHPDDPTEWVVEEGIWENDKMKEEHRVEHAEVNNL